MNERLSLLTAMACGLALGAAPHEDFIGATPAPGEGKKNHRGHFTPNRRVKPQAHSSSLKRMLRSAKKRGRVG